MAKTKQRKNKDELNTLSPSPEEELAGNEASSNQEGVENEVNVETEEEVVDGNDPTKADNLAPDEIQPDIGREEINNLETEVSDLKDKLLRALAESENIRRRAQRDREDASKYGIKNFAEMVIKVADNLERGLQSIEAEDKERIDVLKNMAVGIEMVQRELLSGLEQFGVFQMKAMGEKFDPLLHEAMFEIENLEVASGTICQVLEVGYLLHDRTLRAAKVGITKGGPKQEMSLAESETGHPKNIDRKSAAEQSAYEDKKLDSGNQIDEEL